MLRHIPHLDSEVTSRMAGGSTHDLAEHHVTSTERKTHATNITMVAKILQSPFATACHPGQFQPRDHIFRNTINPSATRGSARSSTEGFRDPREAGSHHPEACHAHNEWRETKAGPNWKVIHEKTISTVGEISDVKKKATPYDKRGNLKNYHG
ncbi:hypothetical protein ACIPV3_01480 [Streptomyces albidoflavus]